MPGPQPMDVDWGIDTTPNGSHVVLVANTAQGQSVFFLNFTFVQQFLDALVQAAAVAQEKRRAEGGGLVMPANVVLGPNGQPLLVQAIGQQPVAVDDPTEVVTEDNAGPREEASEPSPFRLIQGGGSDG